MENNCENLLQNFLKVKNPNLNKHLGQNNQEWTNYNLWKTAFKNLKGDGILKQTISPQNF